MKEYCFAISNIACEEGISYALSRSLDCVPVVVCVGTDATIGDALGPIVGTMLEEHNAPCYIYGSLEKPITAKEIVYLKEFLASAHPYSKVLVIDAAVGKPEDIGFIKVSSQGLKPGLGANKNLPMLGNVSIIGIVAERSINNYALFNLTRLGAIYQFATIITDGILNFLKETSNSQFTTHNSQFLD